MRRRPSTSTLVAAGALSLSIGAAILTQAIEQEAARAELRGDARELHQRLEARLDVLVALLRGGAGLHATLGIAPDDVFATYIDRLDLERNYPGVLGIGFAARVPVARIEAFEADVREVWPDFRVHPPPLHDGHAYAIRLLEPRHARNEAAIGFDMGAQPARLEAMERAILTGLPSLTGRVQLVQEITPDKQAGFLVYVPVYADGDVPSTAALRMERALGLSYAPLRAGDFFAPLATDPDAPAFEIYAGSAADPETLLFSSAPRQGQGWHLDLPLTAPTTDWFVRYTHPPPATGWPVLTVGGLGLLLSLGLYLASLTAERRERERNQLFARDAVVARAVEGLSDSPPLPLPMLEHLSGWLVGEGLASGVEARHGPHVVLLRGEPVGNASIRHEVAGLTVRIAPRTDEGAELIARVLERAGWLLERAALHEQASVALTRNEAALKFAEVFVGVLGHDLRNPLSAISTASQLLLRLDPDAKQRGILERVLSSVARMSRLIDQILDLTRARIGGGIPVHRVDGDVAEIVADIVSETRTAAPDREIHCHSSGDTRVAVDRDRIAQALSNVLGNAVQHGEPGPIEVEVAGGDDDTVRIRVWNPGTVPPDVLPTVFEPFRSGTSGEGGLGLGMYIARTIVEAHQGRIAMDSSPGVGTVVHIELPRLA